MKKHLCFSAFTLAEILVVLVIMGVVVAMTLPALKAHTDEQKFVSLTKKAYKEIADATAQLEITYGNSEFWDWEAYANEYSSDAEKSQGGPDLVRSWYKKVMNVDPSKKLTTKNNWGVQFKGLNGEGIGSSMRNAATFATVDGFCWSVGGDNGEKRIIVDVNCDIEPNIVGIDVHSFNVTDDGVVPAGTKGVNNGYGATAWNCTAYVIKHGKMPWLNRYMTSCPAL